MSKKPTSKAPMTPKAAKRIQGNADRSNTNQGFNARAQRAAAKPSSSGPGKGGKNK